MSSPCEQNATFALQTGSISSVTQWFTLSKIRSHIFYTTHKNFVFALSTSIQNLPQATFEQSSSYHEFFSERVINLIVLFAITYLYVQSSDYEYQGQA